MERRQTRSLLRKQRPASIRRQRRSGEAASLIAAQLAPIILGSRRTARQKPEHSRQAVEELRGGMKFRVFRVAFKAKNVVITVYEMPDGKLEQYLVIPAD